MKIEEHFDGNVPKRSVTIEEKNAIFDEFFEENSDATLHAKNAYQRNRLWANAMTIARKGQKIRQGSGISNKYKDTRARLYNAEQNAARGEGFAALFEHGNVNDFMNECNELTEVAGLFLSMLTEQARSDLGLSAEEFDQLSEEERAKAIGDVDKIGTMLKMNPVMSYAEAHELVLRAADSRGGDHALLANAPVMKIYRGFKGWASDTSNLRGASDRVR